MAAFQAKVIPNPFFPAQTYCSMFACVPKASATTGRNYLYWGAEEKIKVLLILKIHSMPCYNMLLSVG